MNSSTHLPTHLVWTQNENAPNTIHEEERLNHTSFLPLRELQSSKSNARTTAASVLPIYGFGKGLATLAYKDRWFGVWHLKEKAWGTKNTRVCFVNAKTPMIKNWKKSKVTPWERDLYFSFSFSLSISLALLPWYSWLCSVKFDANLILSRQTEPA